MATQTQLLLQWAYTPTACETEARELTVGLFDGMQLSRGSYAGVPQLFVTLDEPTPDLAARAADVAAGANISYCMTRSLTPVPSI